jgi:hypothetical protein
MVDEKFQYLLRLNLLETFKPSAAVKNIKRLNIVDIEAKIKPLYMFSKHQITFEEIMKEVQFLESNGYIDKTWIDDIEYWSMSEIGKSTLKKIHEGEDIIL